MKKSFVKCTIFALLAVVSLSSTAFAKESTTTSNNDPQMKELIAKSKKDAEALSKNWNKLKVVTTPDAIAEANGIDPKASVNSENMMYAQSKAASNSVGRWGNILITPSNVLGGGSITGHAAMVATNSDVTIESMPSGGVQYKRNDWKTRYPKALCARVPGGNGSSAVDYASKQIGKEYNYIIPDKWKTNKFYCSQLVWRAYYNQGIDLDKDGGDAVLPTDLVSNKIEIIWRNNY